MPRHRALHKDLGPFYLWYPVAMGEIIQPFNSDEAGHGPESPIAQTNIGGFPIDYFKKPGVGVSPPPKEMYKKPDGETDYQKMAGETLKWTADKTVDQGIILSAVVRELLVLRKALDLSTLACDAHQKRINNTNAELASLRLELAKKLG